MEKFYGCYIEGKGGSWNKLLTVEKAEREAERLAALPENKAKRVYVLEAIEVCQAEVPLTYNPPIYWGQCE